MCPRITVTIVTMLLWSKTTMPNWRSILLRRIFLTIKTWFFLDGSPSNLKTILTNARLEARETAGVSKCNKKRYQLCNIIIITGNKITFKPTNNDFYIKFNMTCNSTGTTQLKILGWVWAVTCTHVCLADISSISCPSTKWIRMTKQSEEQWKITSYPNLTLNLIGVAINRGCNIQLTIELWIIILFYSFFLC